MVLQRLQLICYTGVKMSKTPAHQSTSPVAKGGKKPLQFEQTPFQRQTFFVMALNMSWQLAVVVLLPVIGGAELDKHLGTRYIFTLIGLLVAVVASSVVVWRALQTANQLPVPKLTAKQKRDIQKSFEEDDT